MDSNLLPHWQNKDRREDEMAFTNRPHPAVHCLQRSDVLKSYLSIMQSHISNKITYNMTSNL